MLRHKGLLQFILWLLNHPDLLGLTVLPYLSLIMVTICTICVMWYQSWCLFSLSFSLSVVATFGSAPRCSLYQFVKFFQTTKVAWIDDRYLLALHDSLDCLTSIYPKSIFASIPVHHWNLHVRVSIQSIISLLPNDPGWPAKFSKMLRFSPGHGWAQCRKFFTTGITPTTWRGIWSVHMFSPGCTSSIKQIQNLSFLTRSKGSRWLKLTKTKHAQRFKAPPCRISEMHRLKPWQRQRARSFAVLSHSWTGNGLGKERDHLPCQQCAKPPKMIAVNDGKTCKKHQKVINSS